MTITSSLSISWGRDLANALRISGEARTGNVSGLLLVVSSSHTVFSCPSNKHPTQPTTFLSFLPSLNEKWCARNMGGELTTLSHDIKDGDA